MKKVIFFFVAACMLSLGANAQLSPLMSKYHGRSCVTVTLLDQSLYGLYKQNNLTPETEELLKNLKEVNILNLNLNNCSYDITKEITQEFKTFLDHPEKYHPVKSYNDDIVQQWIYSKAGKDGQITDLVVWNQDLERLDIIELRGKVQVDKVALLAKALNIHGLNSLSTLSSNQHPYSYTQKSDNYSHDFTNMEEMASQLERMAEQMQEHFTGNDWGNKMEEMFGSLGQSFENMEKMFNQFGDATNMMSNSVQVTEENGKTKIKINSKNSDMSYVIDGQEFPKDSVQMPEGILSVNIIPSKEDLKKSYLFVTSKDKLGDFVNFKNGVLTFKYNNQEYKFNLDKAKEPLLVIDGRLSNSFDLDPSAILQIRPLSTLEKQIGYYPTAEVIINTK